MRAFFVGLACSLLQVNLVYCVGFLYSATAPAYLTVMLSWFLGGAAGCWLPAAISPRLLFVLAAALHGLNTWSLTHGIYLGTWLGAACLGGMAGSRWLCGRAPRELQSNLLLETMGMAAGFAASHVLIYRLGIGLIWASSLLAILLTVKEGGCEREVDPGIQSG